VWWGPWDILCSVYCKFTPECASEEFWKPVIIWWSDDKKNLVTFLFGPVVEEYRELRWIYAQCAITKFHITYSSVVFWHVFEVQAVKLLLPAQSSSQNSCIVQIADCIINRVRTIVPSYYHIGRKSDYQTTIVPADCFRQIVFPQSDCAAVLLWCIGSRSPQPAAGQQSCSVSKLCSAGDCAVRGMEHWLQQLREVGRGVLP